MAKLYDVFEDPCFPSEFRNLRCMFCQRDLTNEHGEPQSHGVFWVGPTITVICYRCIREGNLGNLVADAILDAHNLELYADAPNFIMKEIEYVLWQTERQALNVILMAMSKTLKKVARRSGKRYPLRRPRGGRTRRRES